MAAQESSPAHELGRDCVGLGGDRYEGDTTQIKHTSEGHRQSLDAFTATS